MSKTHRPPIASPQQQNDLQRLLTAEPDLVDRIFDYVVDLMPEIAGRAGEVKDAVRSEFSGQKCWVAKRGAADRQALAQQVLRMFDGRNATEVARRLNISRATVYRYIKQAG